jgi:hypothetical protein
MALNRRTRTRRRHRRLPAPGLRTHRPRHQGPGKALAGLNLLDQALALELRRPQDYFHRIWSINFRVTDLAAVTDDTRRGPSTKDNG